MKRNENEKKIVCDECGMRFGFASHDSGEFGPPFCPKCGSYDTRIAPVEPAKIAISATTVTVDGRPALSKWWMTPSAKSAMNRAKEARNARIVKVRDAFMARRAAEDAAIWGKAVAA